MHQLESFLDLKDLELVYGAQNDGLKWGHLEILVIVHFIQDIK